MAFVGPAHTGSFQIRCAELCGLWHGHMSKKGRVLATSAFQTWIAAAQKKNASIVKYLPKYSRVYFPAPLRRAAGEEVTRERDTDRRPAGPGDA